MSCVLAKKCTDCNIISFISQDSLPGVILLQTTVTIMSNISIVVLIMNSIQINSVGDSSSRPGIDYTDRYAPGLSRPQPSPDPIPFTRESNHCHSSVNWPIRQKALCS